MEITTEENSILVTGGTGLLGSHLLRLLVSSHDKNTSIKAVYRHQHPDIDGVEWLQTDIFDVIELADAMQGMDQVYHCAGMVDFHPGQTASLKKVNVAGTANIVNAALEAGVHKLLHVSSVAAIGGHTNEMIDEHYQWNEKEKHTAYAESKYLGEMEVWRAAAEGLNTVIVNPSVILGCGDWNKGSSQMFKSVYDGFPWYTEGIHGFVDVIDVAKAMYLLMNSNVTSERFVINGYNISYKELFNLIADGFGVSRPSKKVTPLLAEIVWRWKASKGWLTGKPSLLTKDTARTAMSCITYDNTKILQALPQFQFSDLKESVNRICKELAEK